MLIGSKIDRIEDQVVLESEGAAVAQKYNSCFFQVSSLNDKVGVDLAFETLVRKILTSSNLGMISAKRVAKGIDMAQSIYNDTKGNSCCW